MAKKLLILSIVFILALGSLAACGGKKAEEQTNTPPADSSNSGGTNTDTTATTELKPEDGAKLLVWESGGKDLETAKQIAEAFTKKYNVPVDVQEVGATDQVGKLTTDGPAGLGADVVTFPHDQLGGAVSAGLLLPNDVYADQVTKDFLPAAVTGVSFDGQIFGYPRAIETYALFYNKDLVKTPPATYDELVATAKSLTDVKKKKFGFMWDVSNFYFTYSFISGMGGYVFGQNGTDPADIGLNSDGAVQALDFIKSFKKDLLPLNTADITGDIKTSLFNEGKLAMNIDGPWAVAGFRDAKVNFGVAPLPTLPNGNHPASFSGIRALYVNAYTKYPDAAKLYAEFATNKDNLILFFKNTGQLPARNDLVNDPSITSDPISAAFLAQAQYAQPMPSIPAMGSVWGPGAAAITTIWNDNTDSKKALDAAVSQIKEAISASTK